MNSPAFLPTSFPECHSALLIIWWSRRWRPGTGPDYLGQNEHVSCSLHNYMVHCRKITTYFTYLNVWFNICSMVAATRLNDILWWDETIFLSGKSKQTKNNVYRIKVSLKIKPYYYDVYHRQFSIYVETKMFKNLRGV